jgi:hypothetical protein
MHRVYFPTNSCCKDGFIMSGSSTPPSQPKPASYLPLRTVRLRSAVPVVQAATQAPSLAALAQLAQQSIECLRLVAPLLPPAMRPSVQAGPLNEGQWCLLVANSAVAAKLRQLIPALTAHLRTHGKAVHEIRIKIMMRA